MIELMAQSESGIERPLEPWKYVYVAGSIDFGSNLTVTIGKNDEYAVGYVINPKLYISNKHRGSLKFIEEFCDEHQIRPRIREMENTYRLEITRRDDLRKLFELVKPYLLARHEPVDMLLTELFPKLERGENTTKEQFIKLVEIADEIRDMTSSRGKAKYDTEYFENEWNL